MPYLSYPVRQTHVGNLRLFGLLFGMQPPDCRACRVLEIGGASGGNLLPMAAALPQSEFVCIDPSVRQVEEGRRHAAALGLKNLRFEAQPVEKLKRKSEFDYVICHGVFSWVPQPVQDAIFAALQACLAKNGIAFVSYKALPGWHAHRALRESLLWHCAQAPAGEERARRAREMLEVLRNGAQDPRSTWGPVMVAEIDRLRATADEFLLHDTLEEHNEAFYFSTFMARARRHRLQYLGDADVHSMYAAGLPPWLPAAVAAEGDVEALEQYIDFGLNRLFRQTLLCRDSVPLNRAIALDAIDGCYVQSFLMPEASPAAQSSRTYRAANGAAMATADTVVAEVLATLAIQGKLPVSTQAVFAQLQQRLPGEEADAMRTTFRRTLLQAYFAGGLHLDTLPPAHVAAVSARPLASAVARHEATYRPVVTNGRHEAVAVSPFEQALIPRLDGHTAVEDLAGSLGVDIPTCAAALDRLAASALLSA